MVAWIGEQHSVPLLREEVQCQRYRVEHALCETDPVLIQHCVMPLAHEVDEESFQGSAVTVSVDPEIRLAVHGSRNVAADTQVHVRDPEGKGIRIAADARNAYAIPFLA